MTKQQPPRSSFDATTPGGIVDRWRHAKSGRHPPKKAQEPLCAANEPYIGAFQTSFITRSQFSPMTRPISESE
jgi:hypothetical protein